MPRSVEARLTEMLDEIVAIRTATEGMSFGAFCSQWSIQRGVERGLEIISEASRSIPDELICVA
jgi:uncharacterized protein with HEPN domain